MPGHKFLAVGLMQLVVEQFREEIKLSGEAGGGKQRGALQGMKHVSAVIRFGQYLPRFMRGDSDGWSHYHQTDALREIRLQRHHAINVVGERQHHTAVVGRGGIIDVAFNLFRPAQNLLRMRFFPAVLGPSSSPAITAAALLPRPTLMGMSLCTRTWPAGGGALSFSAA